MTNRDGQSNGGGRQLAVSLEEAARLLGVSSKTVNREIQRGEIQDFRAGLRLRRILITEIERYIQSRM